MSVLLEASSQSPSDKALDFTRSSDGWIFISASCRDRGPVDLILDRESRGDKIIVRDAENSPLSETMRYVTKGRHTIQVGSERAITVDKLVVKAIPELIHCGLGFNPEIKAYGLYDMDFLKTDILPNITTLIVPNSLALPQRVIEDWHRQGKRFIGEVGIDAQATTAEEHAKFWTSFFDRTPSLDGIIIDEFIVNNLMTRPGGTPSADQLKRMEQEQQRHKIYGEAIRMVSADERYRSKMLYAYIGGSGKKLNQEMIGTNFVRTILNSGYRIALERYLHEMSSEKASKEALQTLVDGIADWEVKEPGVKKQMVIAFGLLSMPPGSINKQPNVDYHVWMDLQMNRVANDPLLHGMGGLEWWTSSLADEETVRFVGKLYRHYAIEGKTEMLTSDPLFLTHIQNADFDQGSEGWILKPAEEGSISARRFPRYGRIEGRFMGLWRPPDPEHIGDTFLWMKRSEKGPNTFSQIIQNLEPGRSYSMKMFSCDYNDLGNPKARKREEAAGFIGSVSLEGVEVDSKRSFSEMYPSSPEPKIPVWITYHWKVFRARERTAKLTVSDWATEKPNAEFGQEQIFNFVEIQPYHE